MIVYAESSAVLSWLLGEDKGEQVGEILRAADFVAASQLTLAECERALHRARHLDRLTAGRAEELRALLAEVTVPWFILTLSDEIFDRSKQPFPVEPIRTLDALHLATVLELISLAPGTALLTLDKRVRRCARALGIELLPREDHG